MYAVYRIYIWFFVLCPFLKIERLCKCVLMVISFERNTLLKCERDGQKERKKEREKRLV